MANAVPVHRKNPEAPKAEESKVEAAEAVVEAVAGQDHPEHGKWNGHGWSKQS